MDFVAADLMTELDEATEERDRYHKLAIHFQTSLIKIQDYLAAPVDRHEKIQNEVKEALKLRIEE